MAAVVVVKMLYVAAVFYAYSISQALPVAVFLFSIKARWVELVVMVTAGRGMTYVHSFVYVCEWIQLSCPHSLQLCCGVCVDAEAIYIREETHRSCSEYSLVWSAFYPL